MFRHNPDRFLSTAENLLRDLAEIDRSTDRLTQELVTLNLKKVKVLQDLKPLLEEKRDDPKFWFRVQYILPRNSEILELLDPR